MKKTFLLFVIFALIAILGYGNSGCGKKDEKESGNSDVKKEDVKKENATDKEQVKNDDNSKSNDLQMTEGLPKNYPGDIPQPKNSKCLGSFSSSDGTVVNFETSDKVKDIVDFFKDEMKKNDFDIQEGADVLVSDAAAIVGWKKKDRDVSVIIGYDKEKSKSQVTITYK